MNDELRPHYDLRQLLPGGVQGKYAERYRAGTNLVLLEPDIAKAFTSDEEVNEALRLVLQMTQIRLAKSGAWRNKKPETSACNLKSMTVAQRKRFHIKTAHRKYQDYTNQSAGFIVPPGLLKT